MTIWEIIGIASAVGILAVIVGALALGGLVSLMEEYRRDLEGLEIDGDWLFDGQTTPVPDHQRQTTHRSKQDGGEVRGVFNGSHGKGL